MPGYSLRLVGIVLAFTCCACASTAPHQFVGPHGRTAFSLQCNQGGRTLDECYKTAWSLCPAGYDFVERGAGLAAETDHVLAFECKVSRWQLAPLRDEP